jgi:hypothetical protein
MKITIAETVCLANRWDKNMFLGDSTDLWSLKSGQASDKLGQVLLGWDAIRSIDFSGKEE